VLGVHLVLECAAFSCDESPIALRIDPGLHAFGLGPFSFGREIKILSVVAAPDIGLKHLQLIFPVTAAAEFGSRILK